MANTITFKGKTYQMKTHGRPKKTLTDDEIVRLLEERQTMTVKQMAALHGKSEATIYSWFRIIKQKAGESDGQH